MDKQKKQVIAFDFGASSGRCIIGTLAEGKILINEVHRFTNDPVKVNNTWYWDILRLFHEIKQGMLKAKQQGEFLSVGIDTWGVDFGLLDEHGVLLENPVHYRDDRTLGMQEKVFAKISKERLYQITGIQIENFNTIYQLASLAEERPHLLERADTLLLTPDLLNYLLTGKKAAEYTIASTTQLMDAEKKCWSDEVMKALGIPQEILPEIVQSGTVIGEITPSICEELDMHPAKVTAVCGHDTQSAIVSVPTQDDDFIFIITGTWSLFGTELNAPIIDERTLAGNISNEGGYGDTSTLLKNIIGLWLIQESRRQWHKEGKEYSFAELEALAEKAEPHRCYIDPSAPEFVAAGNIPRRIRAFCEKTGQHAPETVGEVVRCIYESLALKYRHTLEQIEECAGKSYPVIHMIGGGIQSKMLCRMTAAASGRKVIAGPVEGTALGNIAVQFMAMGEIGSLKEARQIIKNSEPAVEYVPEASAQWEEAYRNYTNII